jgi:hypothetical protein
MNGTCAAAAVARPSVSSIGSVAPSSTAKATVLSGDGVGMGSNILNLVIYFVPKPTEDTFKDCLPRRSMIPDSNDRLGNQCRGRGQPDWLAVRKLRDQ